MTHDPKTPTFNELVEALRTLQSAGQGGISRHISTIVVAVTLALFAWVGASLLDVKSSVDKISVTTVTTKETTSDMSKDLKSLSDRQTRGDARQEELERRIGVLEKRGA